MRPSKNANVGPAILPPIPSGAGLRNREAIISPPSSHSSKVRGCLDEADDLPYTRRNRRPPVSRASPLAPRDGGFVSQEMARVGIGPSSLRLPAPCAAQRGRGRRTFLPTILLIAAFPSGAWLPRLPASKRAVLAPHVPTLTPSPFIPPGPLAAPGEATLI